MEYEPRRRGMPWHALWWLCLSIGALTAMVLAGGVAVGSAIEIFHAAFVGEIRIAVGLLLLGVLGGVFAVLSWKTAVWALLRSVDAD